MHLPSSPLEQEATLNSANISPVFTYSAPFFSRTSEFGEHITWQHCHSTTRTSIFLTKANCRAGRTRRVIKGHDNLFPMSMIKYPPLRTGNIWWHSTKRKVWRIGHCSRNKTMIMAGNHLQRLPGFLITPPKAGAHNISIAFQEFVFGIINTDSWAGYQTKKEIFGCRL